MAGDFLDIHAHFVYGVDDGARSEEQMRAMLDAASENGVTALFATSHAAPGLERFPQETYARHLESARDYCRAKGYELNLYPGAAQPCCITPCCGTRPENPASRRWQTPTGC